MANDQKVTQAIVVDQTSLKSGAAIEQIALFDSSGAPISRILDTVPDGGDVLLTGFTSGSAGALAATDTVNEAFGKLQARTLSAAPTGANVLLTGFTTGTKTAVLATDSANAAIAKLVAYIADLETRVYTLEHP